MAKFVYHERQESALCGQHCLNNLLQGPYFTAPDLASIAAELDIQERALGNNESMRASANVDDSGNFSIQVLRVALQRFNGIDLRVWFQKTGKDADPTAQKGFIVNRSEHWITIRKIHDNWWNLNSVNENPERVGEFYLTALLNQLRDDGYTIFIVDGNIPEYSDPKAVGLSPNSGVWHEEQVLLRGGSAPEKKGFQAFTGTGHRLDGRSTGATNRGTIATPYVDAAYDEEAELAKAIQASLEPPRNPKEDLRAKRLAALAKQGQL
jgi:Ataxin-3